MAGGTVDMSDHPARGRDQARERERVLALATQIVSAHVAHNQVRCTELPGLIQEVCRALAQAGASSAAPGGLVPAVPVDRSVFPDYIICLENGRRFRTLRRHLMAAFSLTPEQYRRRWGLPHDYPMIAPGYARDRSGLAKATGLGRRAPAAGSGTRRAAG